jgi:ARG and Rhodanese-Phosphatase-superfamily-associated Protein domain
MQMLSYVAAGLAVFGFAGAAARTALAEPPTRISGPYAHENLAVYFIHGKSAPGPVPLTLQEALEKGSVRVLETGAVNELKIENTGSEDIFIQSGDIVKGGRQDRVLAMSFILPPKSGEVALAAFCVEHGRWSARGAESAVAFSSATEALPSREAKLAMRAPIEAAPEPANSAHGGVAAYTSGGTYVRQGEVWNSVAATQMRLSDELSAPVASPRSATSLQLSLENEKLKEARAGYIKALQDRGTKEDDIVGYALAINGRISSADVYPSNALFRKMWEKQLTAGVTEAIGDKTDATTASAPSTDSVAQFLAAAEKPKAEDQVVNDLSRQEVRDADKSLFVEAQSSSGAWVHRSYLAK